MVLLLLHVVVRVVRTVYESVNDHWNVWVVEGERGDRLQHATGVYLAVGGRQLWQP